MPAHRLGHSSVQCGGQIVQSLAHQHEQVARVVLAQGAGQGEQSLLAGSTTLRRGQR